MSGHAALYGSIGLYGLIGLAVVTATGCGGDVAAGLTVSGTVTCEGKPLSGAVVTLEPLPGTTGPNASAPVLDGKFRVESDAGLHGGSYRARFEMIPIELRKAIPAEHAGNLPPDDAVIDPDYDANSKQTCKLVAEQENSLEFEIEFLK